MTTWRQALVDAHPDLFRIENRDYSYAPGYPAVGDGWCELVEKAIVRIAAADIGHSVRIEQVKEKYGTIRLDWSSVDALDDATYAAVEEAVELAEARSECTCELCGREGRLYSAGDWLSTVCPDHARGEPIPIRPGHENIRVVTTFVGDVESVSCRRYVRETDSFVDVDPATLDLTDE